MTRHGGDGQATTTTTSSKTSTTFCQLNIESIKKQKKLLSNERRMDMEKILNKTNYYHLLFTLYSHPLKTVLLYFPEYSPLKYYCIIMNEYTF